VGVLGLITINRIRLILVVGISGCLSLFVLEILPDGFFAEVPYLNASLSFGLLAVFGFALIRFFRLGTLEYFRLPQMTKSTMVAVALVAVVTVPPIFLVDREGKSLLLGLLAILFVFSVGLGEEIFSRGFHYGFLEKYGRYLALVVSSFVFGLMHLNRYIGDDWDGWKAYSHVIAAFGFGLLACALMIATKSIWVAVIFHTMANWDLAFPKVKISNVQEVISEDLLGRLLMPVAQLISYGFLAMVILLVSSGRGIPQRVQRLMISLKLVDSNV
jgi:membrane protease YdiL (CAAX protease family)